MEYLVASCCTARAYTSTSCKRAAAIGRYRGVARPRPFSVCLLAAMGKNRDLRRAQARRAQQAEPVAATHIIFTSPVWKVPFWWDVRTGESAWVPPAEAVGREASPAEQLLLNDVELTKASEHWDQRSDGVLEGPISWAPQKEKGGTEDAAAGEADEGPGRQWTDKAAEWAERHWGPQDWATPAWGQAAWGDGTEDAEAEEADQGPGKKAKRD